MSISFGNINAADMYFGDKTVAEVYFGDKLVWSGKRLVIGTDKQVCIEFVPSEDIVATSQNPVVISVFMNTDSFTTANPPMWVVDGGGVCVGYSTNGAVGSQETIKKQTGYKRTNTFSDGQLYLKAGTTYYICYLVYHYDQDDHYFAHYNKGEGNYKIFNNASFLSSAVHNLDNYNSIGDVSSYATIAEAAENDLFVWRGGGTLTSGEEYVRNSTQLNNYVSALNFGSTDKYTLLNHILFMDKGDGTYGAPGDKFDISATYGTEWSHGPSGMIERSQNYTNHVWTPPDPAFFSRAADAYKYIFDPAVHLSDNDSNGKALVWGNDYIYTNGQCYYRGGQYLGYSCYESRTSSYIDDPGDIASVSANELFYLEPTIASKVGTSEGLKIRGNQTVDAVAVANSSDSSPKQFATIAVQISHGIVWYVGDALYYPFGSNKLYTKTGSWNATITSTTPLTTEPASPATDDVYYKAGNVTWGNISDECIVKWNGSSWTKVSENDYGNYFSYQDAQNIVGGATTAGILTEFSESNLYQNVNMASYVAGIGGNTSFANTPVSSDKKFYLEINGQEV